jgi:dihydrofolate reductase
VPKLVYDLAVSADGFITDPHGGYEGFLFEGDHVLDYQARLARYGSVVMGRATYEAGYAFGMKPGDKPYPDLEHHVLSRTLVLPAASEVKVERGEALTVVDRLKAGEGSDVYLCGGGKLAGHLLKARRIDRLILKLNPVVVGGGVRLFENAAPARLDLVETRRYASGVTLLSYDVGHG